nr:hypothetical protein [uncultured Rhizobium sp.]
MVTKFSRLQSRRTSTPGKVFSAAELIEGELGVNLADETLYSKKIDGTVFAFATLKGVVTPKGLTSDWNGTTGSDNFVALQAALDTGRTVSIPPGKYAYRGTLKPSYAYQMVFAYGAEFTWLGPAGGGNEAFAMLIPLVTAKSGVWRGGVFDHRGSQWVSATTGPAVNNRALESAVMVMADSYDFSCQAVKNGFDNGVGIGAADLTTGAQMNGNPSYAKVHDVYTENCGCGIRTHDAAIGPHQAGSGINLLSGSRCTIYACHDSGSRANFIADYGGGASGQFLGCVGDGAKRSISGTVSFEGENVRPGGFGIYSGASHVKWIGIQINDAEGWAGWWDGFSANNDIDLTAKYCGNGGVLINGRGHKGTIRVHDAGHLSPGVYPGIRVRGNSEGGDSYGIQLTEPHVEGPYAAYGLDISTGPGNQKVFGGSDGGMVQGTLSPVRNNQPDSFSVSNFRDFSQPKYVRDHFNYVNAAGDAAAASAGVPVGGKYRSGSALMTRVS